jgi:hypothetical protein
MTMRLANALGFQLGWWLCVLSVRLDAQAWALAGSVLLSALQWRHSKVSKHLMGLVGRVLFLGVALDSALQAAGWIQFQGWALGPLAPFWLWAIWLMFALTLNESMVFLNRWPVWIQALIGGVAGPLSYGAGASLGAATLLQPWTLWAYALAWMVLLPLLLKWSRFETAQQPSV